MGGPCDFSVSPKSFFLGKGSDLDQGLTIIKFRINIDPILENKIVTYFVD